MIHKFETDSSNREGSRTDVLDGKEPTGNEAYNQG